MPHSTKPPQGGSLEPYTVFTTWQRTWIVTIVDFAATLSGFASNIYFPALPQIAQDLSISDTLINLTVTCYLIFQGLSPTLWGSLSDSKGRRITYCYTLSVFLGACIGLAETRSYAQLIVLRCMQSTGNASTIALGGGVIGAITTKEKRGSYMGFFQGGLLMPVAIGPVVGGVLAERLEWRSVFWFLTIYGSIYLLLILLTLPETLRSMVGNGSIEPPPYGKSPMTLFQRKQQSTCSHPSHVAPEKAQGTKRIDFLGPLKIIFQIKTLYTIILVAIHYTVWQMVLTALSLLFEQKYHVNETQTGLIFLANGGGSLIGTVLTGKLLEHDYKKMIDKNRDNEEQISAERARLRTAWIWSALECASCLTFGWTIDRGVHISVPIICLFVLGWAPISLQGIVATYLVDIHHDHSASAMASLNLARCLLGAGGTAAVGPLLNRLHAGWTFSLLTAIMGFSGGLVLSRIFSLHEQREDR